MSEEQINPNEITETDESKESSSEGTLLNPAQEESQPEKGARKPETDESKKDSAIKTNEGAKESKKEVEIPENYELKAPEGMELDSEALKEFTPVAKELKLTNEQAQKLADIYGRRAKAFETQQKEAYSQQVKKWIEEVNHDKEIGGDNLGATQASCKRALAEFDRDEEFINLMEQTGLGNHPAVLRFVNRVGLSVKEDQGANGKKANASKDINKVLYG